MAECLPNLVWERSLSFLGFSALLAARLLDRNAREIVQRVAAKLVTGARAAPLRLERGSDPGLRWLLALAEVYALPRLVAVGGYNSEWNDHEPVHQDRDGDGCEFTVEAVCSLEGDTCGSRRWRRPLPRMLERRADLAIVPGSERCVLYALGGRQGLQRHASAEVLDLVDWRLSAPDAARGWEPLPPMAIGRSGLVAGLCGRDRLIAAGGRSMGNRVVREAEFLSLSSAGAGWSPLGPMREPREYAASAAVGGGQYWVLGGGPHGGNNTVEVLDLESGSWTPGPDMKMERWGAGAVWHGGRIFVAGGSANFARKQLTTLEVLDPREGTEWQLESFRTPPGPGYQMSLWGAAVAAHGHHLFLCGGVYREAEESQRSIFRIDLRNMELEIFRTDEGRPCILDVPRWCGGACVI